MHIAATQPAQSRHGVRPVARLAWAGWTQTRILEGLNDEQRRAVEAVRGPVCILAGAGSGKTTTITRRIANQVVSGAFRADEILAVTFTDKAAGEMRSRLAALGAGGVRARTFHSAALGLLRRYAPTPPERILASKALVLRRIANRLPAPYKFRPAADLATEIEWAKNRRIGPEAYLYGVDGHEPVIPADLMARVFRDYERWKQAEGWVDFEDVLELAVRLLDEDPHALADLRERYRAFTVDEYQDVNLLQQALLDLWLGASDELCAVGDDYQSIYGFTGATPGYLLALPRPLSARGRHPARDELPLDAAGPRAREPPRSDARRRREDAAGVRGRRAGARRAAVRDEPAYVRDRVLALHAEGVPLEEMAVLVRTNARTVDFESAFARRGHRLPGLVGARARRRAPAPQARARGEPARAEVRRVAVEQGWLEQLPDKLGEREYVRQADLARLVGLAGPFDGDGCRWVDGACTRASAGDAGRGVHLLTLPPCQGARVGRRVPPARRGEGAAVQARQDAGGTGRGAPPLLRRHDARAALPDRHLVGQAEPFPARARRDRGAGLPRARRARRPIPTTRSSPRSRRGGSSAPRPTRSPPTSSSTTRRSPRSPARAPRSLAELAAVPGVGPAKLERYGADVLSALAAGTGAPAPAA